MGIKVSFDSMVQWFSGLCSDCAEKYEAKSTSEDLAGIVFDCKKMFCSGKVCLEKDEFKSDGTSETNPFAVSSSAQPNRYS